MNSDNAAAFLAARDFLIRHRQDYATAYRDFEWPTLDRFNWALDYFDAMVDGSGLMKRELTDDGLHPNDAGYKIMTPLAQSAIDKTMASR